MPSPDGRPLCAAGRLPFGLRKGERSLENEAYMACGLVLDPVFLKHENPAGHPERPERVGVLLDRLVFPPAGWIRIPPPAARDEDLLRVHDFAYLARLKKAAERPLCALDPDTYTSPGTWESASAAAGGSVRLVEEVVDGSVSAGIALVRPPGHHAERDRAMGFCLLNNAAIAAEWARREAALRKVAVVDFDVHHGNGTQAAFWRRGDVLYVSTHQYPFYPGTGAFAEVGEASGEGFTVNFPLSRGKDDGFYSALYRRMVVPILREYGPELIIVSAGYDADTRDPLGGMKLTPAGFAAVTEALCRTAREVADGRICFLLEGGYDLDALLEGVMATMRSIEGEAAPVLEGGEEFEEYRRRVLGDLQRWWKSL